MDVSDSENLYGRSNVYRRVLGLNWYKGADDFMFDFDIICLAAEKLDFFFYLCFLSRTFTIHGLVSF